MDKKEVLIEVKDLKKYFQVGRNQTLKAVDGVNFKIYKGETLGIVGESGCGKTTCGKTVMGLYKATGGEVLFDGVDINKLNKNEKKEFTKRAQIIFQDPYSSLNPRMTVGDIIGEGIDIHKLYTGKERQEKIYELLELVGLNREHALRFPCIPRGLLWCASAVGHCCAHVVPRFRKSCCDCLYVLESGSFACFDRRMAYRSCACRFFNGCRVAAFAGSLPLLSPS